MNSSQFVGQASGGGKEFNWRMNSQLPDTAVGWSEIGAEGHCDVRK